MSEVGNREMTIKQPSMKISVASVPYFWSKEAYFKFYQHIAKSPVDIVYLGETVCSKRRTMTFQDWLEIAKQLTDAGKQVVLSTLTLLEAESELSYLSKIASQKDYLIEANDMAAIEVASQQNNAFVAGCAINIYNNQSLQRLKKLGMTRWQVPVELGKDDLASMADYAKSHDIEVEYQIFGRMPLAYSARCFTARHHRLAKDNCQFKCLDDEQGILIKTQEGESFAQINGVQTQSAKVSHLIDHCQSLANSGVDVVRVVPVSAADTLEVIRQLSTILNQTEPAKFDPERLNNQYEFCNGYWLQIEGMKYVS